MTRRILLAAALMIQASAVRSAAIDPDVALRFEHLSLEDGLSQSTINAIAQDREGFLWIGTEDGLNRFDGYRFTTFKSYPDDPDSLSNGSIWALAADRSGAVWVGTSEGLSRWDPRARRFARVGADPREGGPGTNRVQALLEDHDGNLWVGTDGAGVYRYDPASRAWSALRHDPAKAQSLSEDRVRVLYEDRKKTVWIGTYGGGLDAYDPKTGRFEHFRHDPRDPGSLAGDKVHSILQTSKGELWVGADEGGLTIFDPHRNRTRTLRDDPSLPGSLGPGRVRTILEDGAGRIWIGTDGGLRIWDVAAQRFLASAHEATDPRSLADDDVTTLYQDRSGVLWVGTRNAGLSKWDPSTVAFGLHRHKPNASSTLGNDRVASLWLDERTDTLWIGTFGGGLERLDRRTGTYTAYPLDLDRRGKGPGDGRIMSLYLDHGGSLWIGTYEAGLARLDTRTGRFSYFRHDEADPSSIGSNAVMALYEDRLGTLWAGTFGGGLDRVDRATGRFLHHRHDPKVATSLGSDRVTCILEDRAGTLWVGTDGGGLNRMDRVKDTFTRYRHDAQDPTSLSADVVFSLHEDENGALWVGTQGGGLNRWGPADRRAGVTSFRRYNERNGLPNNHVYAILPDERGRIWMSTNHGLSCFDDRTGRFVNYDATQGLQSNEFNFGARHRASSGELFFGGISGFNAFHPSRLIENDQAPPIVVTSILRRAGETPVDRPLAELGEVVLDHRDDRVTVQLAALDYRAPAKNRYAYRLLGFDDDWIELGTSRRVTFTSLPAGRYELRVRASNNDGRWSEEASALELRVLPPPWRTWWAFTAYAVLAMGAVAALARVQRSRRRREADYRRELERDVGERTRELADRNVELRAILRERDEAFQERERLRDRIAQAHKLESLAVLAGGIAHDFNNLLTGIVGNVSIALSARDEHQRLARLQRVQEAADRAADLTRQMLACAGKGPLVREAVDLSEVVRGVAAHVEVPQQLPPALMLDMGKDLPRFRADTGQITQVVTNLVKNAIEATSDRGGAVVCATTLRSVAPPDFLENHLGDSVGPGAYVCLEVKDDGRGMDEETRARIFDPFFTTKFTGRGLGLPAVLGVVRSLRGLVTVDSAPGRGTSVHVFFPLERDPDERAVVHPAAVEEGAARKGAILVVDDDEAIRELAQIVLEAAGMTVLTATDGSEGIAVFRRQATRIGAVLLDITMPSMNGDEVLREIRRTHAFCPIVLSSGFSEHDISGALLDDPFVLFLQKPYPPDALLAMVRYALALEEHATSQV